MARINGTSLEEIFSTLTLDIVEEMNRLHPYGGVENPMARPILIIMPNCIGSMPSAVTIGRNIGVRMIVEEMLSTKHPMMRRTALIRRSTRNLLCAKPRMNEPTRTGTLSMERYEANDVASPTMNRVAPMTMMASLKALSVIS
jgi:hypothetical protein